MDYRDNVYKHAGTYKTDASNPAVTYFGIAPIGYNTPAGWAADVWIIWGVLADGTEVYPGDANPNKIWNSRAGYIYE